MAAGDVVQALAGRDDQHLHRAQAAVGAYLGRHQGDGLVDALHALHVHCQCIQKYAGHGMPGNLRQRGVLPRLGLRRFMRLGHAPGAYDQYAFGPQPNGRRQGCALAH